MKILDLFAGIGGNQRRAFIEQRGHKYITLDYVPEFNCTITADIFDMTAEKFGYFDFVWASPPCEAFSVAAMGHHWGGGARAYLPKTPHAELSQRLVIHTLQIIRAMKPKAFIIENPRGVLRKLPFMKGLPRTTVTYCQYGDSRIYDIIFNMKTKKCPCCGFTKDVSEFYANASRRDGFTSYCKQCDKDKHKDYVQRNQEKIKEYERKDYKKNREVHLKTKSRYYVKNKETIAEKAKAYLKLNIEKFKEKRKAYHQKNKETRNRQSKERYALHSEEYKLRAMERKAIKRTTSDNTITDKALNEMLVIQNYLCTYCGTDLHESKHLDHIIPISRGGIHSITNVHYVCPDCNLSKKDMLEEEWLKKNSMKPTDLWGFVPGWSPRPMCKNGRKCHESAPRGAKTGVQGLSGAAERAVVPLDLWCEILDALEGVAAPNTASTRQVGFARQNYLIHPEGDSTLWADATPATCG